MTSWLSMGGYAGFVWPAYGLALSLLGLIWWVSKRRERNLLQDLRENDAS